MRQNVHLAKIEKNNFRYPHASINKKIYFKVTTTYMSVNYYVTKPTREFLTCETKQNINIKIRIIMIYLPFHLPTIIHTKLHEIEISNDTIWSNIKSFLFSIYYQCTFGKKVFISKRRTWLVTIYKFRH